MIKENNIIRFKFNFFKVFLIKGNDGDILIDTGFLTTRRKIQRICKNNNVKLVILTHAHIDHVFNASLLQKKFNCKIAIGIDDLNNLDNSIINSVPVNSHYIKRTKLMNYFMKHIKVEKFTPDIILHDNEELDKYGIKLKIINLKGHTNGSIGILYDNCLFAGDALVNRKRHIELSYQMQNKESALQSALKILTIKPDNIYVGHENPFPYSKLKQSIGNIHKQVNIGYYKLDNSAKLFPLVVNDEYNGYFEINITLKKEVNKKLLLQAVNKSLDTFPYFRSQLNNGTFWNYLTPNTDEFIFEDTLKVHFKTCKNNFPFLISCSKNQVFFSISHYLCDGTAGKLFVENVIKNYTNILDGMEDYNNISYSLSDDYILNYRKNATKVTDKKVTKDIYKINGNNLTKVKITNFDVCLSEFKKITQKYSCSVTVFIVSIIIYSIKNTSNYNNKNVVICIPIDIRKYYNSKTINNFFSYFYVSSKYRNLDEIIKDVKIQFAQARTDNRVQLSVNKFVKLGTNRMISVIPLKLKRLLVQKFYWSLANTSSIIVSNFGHFEYNKNIKNIETIINPDQIRRKKCCINSFGNTLKISFSSKVDNFEIEKVFNEQITFLLKNN